MRSLLSLESSSAPKAPLASCCRLGSFPLRLCRQLRFSGGVDVSRHALQQPVSARAEGRFSVMWTAKSFVKCTDPLPSPWKSQLQAKSHRFEESLAESPTPITALEYYFPCIDFLDSDWNVKWKVNTEEDQAFKAQVHFNVFTHWTSAGGMMHDDLRLWE